MAAAAIEFRLLGPLEAVRDGEVLPLGAPKQRALLAMLLLRPGQPVAVDVLAEALWPEQPPGDPDTSVQVYVSQLRRVLGREAIVRKGPGYVLELPSGQFDVLRFRELAGAGRRALESGDALAAQSALAEALALWRGPALADFRYQPFALGEAERLDEERLAALEARLEAELQLGRHSEVAAELEGLTREHPLRERPRALLMRALYGAGRQAEALDVYQEFRRLLDEELGIGPGPELRELERRILRQDPALAPQVAGSVLPRGTVTFLFTDVEGSTELLHELGAEGYAGALAEHRRVLREAFGQAGGVEVDTQGDAFFVAFPTAPGALQAARVAQSELSIPVRIGIHTGTPLVTEEGYVGSDVHKAARIAAAGHGGQVLVSAATAALLEGERLRDLGEHRLKDLSTPERIYQLGDGDFPRLRTLHQTNLPVPATAFLGRQRELAELATLLQGDGARVVTLCGPGGTGKTRLAAQAAGEAAECYPDGVFWASLAPLRDPALVLEQAGQAVEAKTGVAEHLADKRLLLVLDNFEHLVAAARDVAALLASCPNLRVLVTSREVLRIAGEQAYPVPPLAPLEGIELFTARARAADPAFTPTRAVQDVCAKLDNLPLALELAAARVRVLSPEQLLQRLGGRLDLFRGGRDADPRQQTLRATIAWSHDLLDDEERGLFAGLAVFRSGFTLEAAEEVASADVDTLQSLIDKSLLRRTNERFWMLETIREYALERLAESGAEAELRARHAAYFLRFAEQADRQIEDGALVSEPLARVAADHDNLRSVLEWARDHDEAEVLLRLAAALATYWRLRAVYGEARSWQQLALERASSPPEARMRVLRVSAMRAVDERDFARADALLAEHRLAAEEERDEGELRRGMNSAAHLAYYRGDTEAARKQWLGLKEKAAEIGDRATQAAMTVNVGLAAWGSGDYRASLEYSLEAADLFRELEDETGTVVALLDVGWSAFVLGDAVLAEESLREGVVVAGRLEAIHWIANGALALGAVLAGEHEEERGAQFLAAAASLREELGIGFNDAVEERIHQRAVADAKAALGEEAFAEAWARGQAMQPDEIVKFCDGRDGSGRPTNDPIERSVAAGEADETPPDGGTAGEPVRTRPL